MDHSGESKNMAFQIEEETWGQVRRVSREGPGVYYLATAGGDMLLGREFYAVTEEAVPEVISPEALAYGVRDGAVYLFEHEKEGGGWPIVSFEVTRYLTRHGLPLGDHDSIYNEAIFAAEQYPEYFGGLLPPRDTPYGLTTRVKRVAEGVFFVETVQCRWLLALAYPTWKTSIADAAEAFGELCRSDASLPEEAQQLFFRRERCTPAIYELLQYYGYECFRPFLRSREVLETAIYQQCPEYAVWNNRMVMTGHGWQDAIDDLLDVLGCPADREREESPEERAQRESNCIHFWPEEAEKEPLLLPM